MTRSITATALRVELRNLLATLDEGPIQVTKHGKVVAVLAAPSEARDPATHCTPHEVADNCDNCDTQDDEPVSPAVEQLAHVLRSRGALAVDSDEPQEPSGEPVEASEGEDTSEPVSASQEATEAEEGGPRADSPYKLDVEAATGRGQEFYFTEEDDRNLEADLDAWLTAGQPDEESYENTAW